MNENKRIIYIQTDKIQLLDIPRAFEDLDIGVINIDYEVSAQGFNREQCNLIIKDIRDMFPMFVISYDFCETIAQACHECNVPYASWVYDDPQMELYTEYAQYPENFIFVFDKIQEQRLKKIGLSNVYHMPLAILGEKVLNILNAGKAKTIGDITFVGQLYYYENLEKIYGMMPENLKTSIDENIKECFLNWNCDTGFFGNMEDDVVNYLSKVNHNKHMELYPYADSQFYYETAVTARLLANKERVYVINKLAEKYNVNFYTFDKDTSQLCEKVNILPGAKYDTEVSRVYRDSKINLNITLHCIETGASQRIFDVMAAGGFLISNYQEELAEIFEPGREIVLFHDYSELEELIAYYLQHEDERKEIAKNGKEKVLKYCQISDRMKEITEIIKMHDGADYGRLYDEKKCLIEINKALVQCENLYRIDHIKALELISYYTIMYHGNSDLNIKRAEYLMDFGMYMDALECLKQIDSPKEDVKDLIQELSEALGV